MELRQAQLDKIEKIKKTVDAKNYAIRQQQAAFLSTVNVGDILVRYRYYSYNGIIDKNVHSRGDSKTPYQYQVVHIDDSGLVFVAPIHHGNRLGAIVTANQLANMNWVYKCHSLYADSILLDHEYNPFAVENERYQKQREIIKYNNSISHVCVNGPETDELLSKIKPGDTIWYCFNKRQMYLFYEKQVSSISKSKMGYWDIRDANNYILNIYDNIIIALTKPRSIKDEVL